MTQWALETITGDVFTYGGAVLVHGNRAELEFLFPGRKAKDVSNTVLPRMLWSDHPQLKGIVRFPLDRKDFR
jgi:hypothetical protein